MKYTATDRSAALRMLGRLPREAVAEVIGCQCRTLNRWAAELGIDIRRGRGGAKQQLPKKTAGTANARSPGWSGGRQRQ